MSCLENLEFGFANVFVLAKFPGYEKLLCKELIGGKTRIVDVYDSEDLLPVTNW
ncbi:MAG: hypothetical protein II032_07925 [Treponema sp.]|nr:hypothetical protein [Treponema sp.]